MSFGWGWCGWGYGGCEICVPTNPPYMLVVDAMTDIVVMLLLEMIIKSYGGDRNSWNE